MPVIIFPKPLESVAPGVTPTPIMPQALVELDLGNLISGAILDDPLTATLEAEPPGFSPSDITGLVAWYDMSLASSLFTDTARTSVVTADGNEIRGVTDLSGDGHHLEGYGGATTYPLYKTAIQNGLSVARFNGNDLIRTIDAITLSADYTIFWVASRTSTTGYQNVWDADRSTVVAVRRFQTRYEDAANTGTIIPRPGTGTATSVTVSAAGTKDVLSFTVQSNTIGGARARCNGTPGTAQDTPVTLTTAKEMYIGSTNDGGSGPQFLTGDVCEVAHYDHALTAADHNAVGQYLQSKWATPAWTPVT